MEDFIEETFSALDQYYPGSKRKRRDTKEQPKVESKTWDARPSMKPLPNGQSVEMFTLGALAEALGRSAITVRTWTLEGVFPKSPYRLPPVSGKDGKVREGRRLYTRPMIEAAVEVFDKHGLLHLDRVEWSNHKKVTLELSEMWAKIRESEMQTNAE